MQIAWNVDTFTIYSIVPKDNDCSWNYVCIVGTRNNSESLPEAHLDLMHCLSIDAFLALFVNRCFLSIVCQYMLSGLWTTRTQDNSYPGQLVPKTTRTQDNPYPRQLVPKTTRTQDNSYPRQLVPRTTRTQDNSYPTVWLLQYKRR